MGRERKVKKPVSFSTVCVVLNAQKGFRFECLAALPQEKGSTWVNVGRGVLEHGGCKRPERFVAPYVLLYYLTCKHTVDTHQTG